MIAVLDQGMAGQKTNMRNMAVGSTGGFPSMGRAYAHTTLDEMSGGKLGGRMITAGY